VLRGDEDSLDLDRPLETMLVDLVANRDLRLPVRPQVGQDLRLAHLGEPLRDLVREHDRERHELLGLGARVAEHHPLVAGADLVERVVVARVVLHLVGLVDTEGNVRRLFVDRDDDAARLRVEAVLRPVIADVADARANQPWDVHVGLGRDLARDDDQARRDERLARDPPVLVVGQNGVEDRVGDLVGQLVRMALGDRLRGERKLTSQHGATGYRSPRTPLWGGVPSVRR
jgi:hypothetical protein